eukprot:scaffold7358_cov252-Pinguiococcus_pyrenoidosus.AAC.23
MDAGRQGQVGLFLVVRQLRAILAALDEGVKLLGGEVLAVLAVDFFPNPPAAFQVHRVAVHDLADLVRSESAVKGEEALRASKHVELFPNLLRDGVALQGGCERFAGGAAAKAVAIVVQVKGSAA